MREDKFLIIDFEDSFTFNIASELNSLAKKVEVVHFKEYIKGFKTYSKYKRLIWGPGPGHPNEYFDALKPAFKALLNDRSYKHMGICLGHQLICMFYGAHITQRSFPSHGSSVHFEPSEEIKKIGISTGGEVQLYNSLKVEIDQDIGHQIHNEEQLMLIYHQNFLGMQFHPESVGTENSQQFFKFIIS